MAETHQPDQFHRIPLRQQVADQLRREIADRQPGERLEPDTKLAQRLKVSFVTIREAMSMLAHEGLVERKHGIGTFVTKPANQGRIALILGVPAPPRRETYFWLRVTEQLQSFFMERGIQSNIYFARNPASDPQADSIYQQFAEEVGRNGICAAVIVRGTRDPRWGRLLQERRIPFLGPGSGYEVGVDYADFTRAGTRFLVDAGRRHIAFMAWLDPLVPQVNQNCVRVFRETLTQAGGSTRDRWLAGDLHPSVPGAGYEEFKEIWTASDEKPDGLLIGDDVLFADVTTAILEMGIRVPEQLLVVTFANKGSGIHYPFPTVQMEYDPGESARRQGDLLLRLMSQQPVAPGWVYLPGRWVKPAELTVNAEAAR